MSSLCKALIYILVSFIRREIGTRGLWEFLPFLFSDRQWPKWSLEVCCCQFSHFFPALNVSLTQSFLSLLKIWITWMWEQRPERYYKNFFYLTFLTPQSLRSFITSSSSLSTWGFIYSLPDFQGLVKQFRVQVRSTCLRVS